MSQVSVSASQPKDDGSRSEVEARAKKPTTTHASLSFSRERMIHLKATRSGLKASISKKVKELNSLMKQKDKNLLPVMREKLYRLNEIFKNFEAAHYKFHGLCEADGSESDAERSQEYFDEIKRTVSHCQSSANT